MGMTKEEVISTLKVWVEHDKAMEYADREENIEIYKMAIKALEQQPCEACREQVLKHLEKEDWADTVNCVMNMPFINKPCVSEGVCREDKIQVLDKIIAEVEQRKKNSGGEPNRDLAFNVCLQIIDKYKAESEE